MRKTFAAAVLLGGALGLSGVAAATPITVGKSGSQTYTFNEGHPSYSYAYNLADIAGGQNGSTGFVPGQNQVTDAELVLNFKNFDERDQAELKIGDFSRMLTNLEEARVQLPEEVLSRLNRDGTLPVTITLLDGNSFRLDDSTLLVNSHDRTPVTDGNGNGSLPGSGGTAVPGGTATGNGAAPVPEPSAMILLGTCLAGSALLLRRGKSP